MFYFSLMNISYENDITEINIVHFLSQQLLFSYEGMLSHQNVHLGDLLSTAYHYTPLPLLIVGSRIITILCSLGRLRRFYSVLGSIKTAVCLAPL